MLAGCGSVDNTNVTDEVRVTETTSPTVTTAPVVEEIQETSESTAETSAPIQLETTAESTEKEEAEGELLQVVGAQTTKAGESTTTTQGSRSNVIVLQTEDGGQATTTKNDTYDRSQPMGNEVLPQSVDNYTTETQPVQSEAPKTEQPPADVGSEYTPKGYKIEEKDGVTYVGGVIIANKTYELPESYGNGLDNEALQAFYEMQSAASQDGIWLSIVSGYRSYWYQDQLYWGYVYSRGGQDIADTFSARAGHSEHQTGLAMDLNNASRSFEGTPEAAWIEQHCADYGFIIRYPRDKEDITGFVYEPWHIRYLGKDMARSVTDSGLCLEEYLGIDSVYRE
ncbi:MAG: M15 family metallopeptidase [Ruminococcus sp.]|nr:M15 family metallopeptidase [Ruminococcus sp.]